MKTGNFLLGSERAVFVRGSRMKVRLLPGSSDVFINEEGAFVLPRWQGKEEGKTPHQRAQKKWSPEELDYVVYPQGLSSALRSRQLAIFKAKVSSMPTYEQASRVFSEEIRETIIKEKTLDLQKISPASREKLRQFGFVFQQARKIGVKEAMVKILFLYQDEERGLNVGAMLARTVAITDRLRERLLGFYAWIRQYSAQEGALKAVNSMVEDILKRAMQQMQTLQLNAAMMSGRLVGERLTALSMELEPLKAIQPFRRWMTFVIQDFETAERAIKERDFVLARAMVERILFSLHLKRIQRSIDRLLLRIGQDAIIKRLAWADYEVWLENLRINLRELSAEEVKVALRERVCLIASEALNGVIYEIRDLPVQRRVQRFRAALKAAYAFL